MTRSKRGLWPREHGAYATLGVALLVGVLGWPSWAGGLLAVALACAFVLHEPLLVVSGARGSRAARQDGARARRRLVALAALGSALAALGLGLGGSSAVAASVAPLVLGGAAVLALARRRRAKALGPELLAAWVMAWSAVPVAVSGGASWWDIGPVAVALGAVFSVQTLTVHAIKALARPDRSGRGFRLSVAALALSGSVLCAGACAIVHPYSARVGVGVGLIVAALVCAAAVVGKVSPRHLRAVGMVFAAVDVALGGACLLAV